MLVLQDVYTMTNASGSIDPACAAVYNGADGWKCLMGEYAVATLQLPYILHSYQYDLYQLQVYIRTNRSDAHNVRHRA